MSDEFVAHKWQLFHVPKGLDNDVAVLIEPFSCALHAVLKAFHRLDFEPEKVLLIGCGTMGLLTIAALRFVERSLGKPPTFVAAIAKYPHQREWAKKFGADEIVSLNNQLYEHLSELTGAKFFRPELGKPTVLGGFDMVFDCVGNEESLNDAVRWTRSKGVLVVIGMPAEPKVSWTSLWFKELKVIGAYAYGFEDWQGNRMRTFEIATELLKENPTIFKGFVTHRFPLAQWRQAFQTAIQAGKHQAIKVTVQP